MKNLFTFLLIMLSFPTFSQSVGIGTNTPDNSAALDISNTSKGILIPRMTSTQRLNISNPAIGLMVYQTDNNDGFWYFDGTVWSKLIRMPEGGSQGQFLTYCDGTLKFTTSGICPASIASINCNEAENNGTLSANLNVVCCEVTSVVNYSGGNGGQYSTKSFPSTGVTGLNAILPGGVFENGNGSLAFAIIGRPSGSGTASFLLNIGGKTCILNRTVNPPVGIIKKLDCSNFSNNGILTSGITATTQTLTIPYSDGDGGPYNSLSINSTGVTGLTASIASGNFEVGNGSLVFNITGTPTSAGTASFSINIGTQSCVIQSQVFSPGGIAGVSAHSCGTANVHNPQLPYGTVTDQDNNVYKTIQIGSQIWMAENLKTTKYQNNDPIPQANSSAEWENLVSAAGGVQCNYDFNAENECPNGKLYSFNVVIDPRNVCPTGWHIPTIGEANVLLTSLDNTIGPVSNEDATFPTVNIAGSKMKSFGTEFWNGQYSEFDIATNQSGFSALPGKIITLSPTQFLNESRWWTSRQLSGLEFCGVIRIDPLSSSANTFPGPFEHGLPIRCVKD